MSKIGGKRIDALSTSIARRESPAGTSAHPKRQSA
jgi:hypothetical protein